jgi:hypothetical protein
MVISLLLTAVLAFCKAHRYVHASETVRDEHFFKQA